LRASLPLSAAAHAAIIALLLLVPLATPTPPRIDLSNAIAVVFEAPPAPPPPVPAPPPPAPTPPPPQVVEQPPPPVIEQPPPPPAPVAEAPTPPPPKPEPKPVPKPRPRPQPVQQPVQQAVPMPQLPMPQLPLPLPNQAPAPQVASIPRPAPTISADYRALLSSWLESHKRYPEEARQRGEEGRAVLRFRVDRSGRVLDYSVVSSTGYGDLDAAVESMMRGAVLPAFPPSMTEPEIEVSVTIRFGLSR
jgi:protein TonB